MVEVEKVATPAQQLQQAAAHMCPSSLGPREDGGLLTSLELDPET
jgi:hypothetical protein